MLSKTYKVALIAVLIALGGMFLVAEDQPLKAQPGPEEILRNFRTLRVESKTLLARTTMLQADLNRELNQLGVSIVTNGDADAVVTFEHQPATFYYSYSMVHPSTGTLLLAGKLVSFDGYTATTKVGKQLIQEIKKARVSEQTKKK